MIENYNKLVYSLNKTQLKLLEDTFIELEFINSMSKDPKKNIRRELKHRRQNSKGKLRKIYVLMLNGDNLVEGINAYSDDIVSHKQNNLTPAMPVVQNCIYFPSKDYIEHSFSNSLCEHEKNSNKACENSSCPLLRVTC